MRSSLQSVPSLLTALCNDSGPLCIAEHRCLFGEAAQEGT